jgi:hypothetical protein
MSVKKGFVLVVVVALLASGVAFSGCRGSLQTTPPAGCEGAISYQIPGFVPYGVGSIRLAIVGISGVSASVKSMVLTAVPLAYQALQKQMPRQFIQTLIAALDPVTSYVPFVSDLLDKAKDYFSDSELTACDREILASLAQNIYHDITGQNVWDNLIE